MESSELNMPLSPGDEPEAAPEKVASRQFGWLPWLGVGTVSALLRFHELGAAPLSPAEAAQAMAALARSGVPSSASSGLLAAANSFVFWLIGPSDFSARLVTALVGTLLPLALLLFPKQAARRRALIAALLLALSPSLTLFSRTSSGAILGCAAILVLLGSLLRFREDRGQRWGWLAVSGAGLGLGIASGGTFLSLAATLLAAVLLARPDELPAAGRGLMKRRPLSVAVACLLLGATGLLFFPSGLGIIGDGLALSGRALAILVVYETLILVSGLCGLVLGLWQGDRFAKVWSWWALAGMLLVVVRPEQPDVPLTLLVPLAFLGAMVLEPALPGGRAVESPMITYGSAVALVALGAHGWISLGLYGRQIAFNSDRATASLILAGVSGILMIGVVALVWTYGRMEALRGLSVALTVLLLAYGWGRAWELGHDHQADPRELWVDQATAPGARILVDTLRTTSERVARASYTLPLTVQSDDTVLRWYLRDFDNVAWVDSLRPNIVSEAVIAQEGQADPLLGSSYLGMDLDLTLASPADPPRSLSAMLRWLLLRDAAAGGQPVSSSRVVVWIRQDVASLGGNALGE